MGRAIQEICMNIAFDLDRIFIDYPPLVSPSIIDWFYRNHGKRGLSYSIPHSKASQIFRRITHISPLRPKLQKNITFIKSFPAKSHKLFLISSRYQFLEGLTKKLLAKSGLQGVFSQIYLNNGNEQPHLFKEQAIKKNNINLYIDDDLELLKYLQIHCPKTKLLWYNPSSIKRETVGITKIRDLSEIKEYLK